MWIAVITFWKSGDQRKKIPQKEDDNSNVLTLKDKFQAEV